MLIKTTLSKNVIWNLMKSIHNYVFVIRNCVTTNVMMIVNLDQDQDLMDSNAITAIQKIHGVMISMKFLPKEIRL